MRSWTKCRCLNLLIKSTSAHPGLTQCVRGFPWARWAPRQATSKWVGWAGGRYPRPQPRGREGLPAVRHRSARRRVCCHDRSRGAPRRNATRARCQGRRCPRPPPTLTATRPTRSFRERRRSGPHQLQCSNGGVRCTVCFVHHPGAPDPESRPLLPDAGAGASSPSRQSRLRRTDFVDNWAKHPAVTTASLVGLPPRLDLAGCDIRIAAKKAPAIWSREWRDPLHLNSLDEIEVFAAEVPLWKPRGTMRAWREGPVDCFQAGVAELPGIRLVVWKGEDGWQARPIAKAREYRGQRVLPFLRVEKTGFSVDLLSTAGVVHPTKASAQKVMQETVREWTSGRERAVSSERAPSYLQGSADQAEWARHRLAAAATDGPLQGRSGTKVFLIDGNTFELYVRQKEAAAIPLATVTYDEHGCDSCVVVSDEIQAHSQKFVTLHHGLLEFFAGEFTGPARHTRRSRGVVHLEEEGLGTLLRLTETFRLCLANREGWTRHQGMRQAAKCGQTIDRSVHFQLWSRNAAGATP